MTIILVELPCTSTGMISREPPLRSRSSSMYWPRGYRACYRGVARMRSMWVMVSGEPFIARTRQFRSPLALRLHADEQLVEACAELVERWPPSVASNVSSPIPSRSDRRTRAHRRHSVGPRPLRIRYGSRHLASASSQPIRNLFQYSASDTGQTTECLTATDQRPTLGPTLIHVCTTTVALPCLSPLSHTI
jgi:hypothetical protein